MIDSLQAEEVILHPAYHDDYSTADLAIIRVHSFKFTEYVQPICLWGPVYDKDSLFGKEATVRILMSPMLVKFV